MRWILLISSGHSIQMQKNTPSSQVPMGHSPGYHILGHKSNHSNFKKTEFISSIFSDHHAMRLDFNSKKKTVRNTSTWRLNNMFLSDQQVTKEIKREIKTFLERYDNENDNSKPIGCSKSSSKREVYSDTILPQETRKTLNRT